MAETNRYLIGLDLSLTGTGLAEYNMDTNDFVAATYGTKGKRSDTYRDRYDRLAGMADFIVSWATAGPQDPQLVVIEGPSIGSRNGSQHDRSGLWWMVVSDLMGQDIPVLVVPPKTRAKYATGNGNSGKDVVLAHVIEQYGIFVDGGIIHNDNEADAIALAAMGARYLGEPQELDLPESNISAMSGVAHL